jgi:hypothetical protein
MVNVDIMRNWIDRAGKRRPGVSARKQTKLMQLAYKLPLSRAPSSIRNDPSNASASIARLRQPMPPFSTIHRQRNKNAHIFVL